MTLLVVGREGQLARSLAEVARKAPGLEIVFAGRPDLDLEIAGAARRLVETVRPEVVINAAAYTAVDQAEAEPERAFQVNVEAAGEIAEAATQTGARLIHISTDYVFDGRSEKPWREDARTEPLSVYGRTKLAGEERVRAATDDHLIVRTSWVVSPFGRNFVRTMMEAARTHDELAVVNDQRGCPTSALDLAAGLMAILARWDAGPPVGLGQTYHLAGTGETSWCGLAVFVMQCCGDLGLPSARVRPIATSEWPTAAVRPSNSVFESSKFARDFGVVMPDWRASVRAIVERIAAGE